MLLFLRKVNKIYRNLQKNTYLTCIYKKKIVTLQRKDMRIPCRINLLSNMKKSIFLLSLVASLIGFSACAGKQKCQNCSEIAVANPIMPVYYTGGVQHIWLTDYLPALTGDEQLTIETDMSYTTSNYTTLEFDLSGDNTLSTLTIYVDSTATYDIPILPHLPFATGLTTEGYTDTTILFSLPAAGNYRVQAYLNDQKLAPELIERGEGDAIGTLRIPECPRGRAFIRLYAANFAHRLNDVLIPLQDGKVVTDASQLTLNDDQTQVLYSLMIDRFSNGNTANDEPLNDPEVLPIVDYQGGDLAGITEKINNGFFEELGITTIWISPITQNPTDAWGRYPFKHGNKYDPSRTYTKFSGYHGYWPIYNNKVDHRFGTPEELRAMLDAAHAHGLHVVLDYVANHLHINSPVIQQHPEWITDSILPDGRRNFELWDEARLTTWFDVHIPSLDLERPEVCEAMTDTALFWLENYPFDGFRHDACKHIPETYWRLLGHKIATRFPGRHIWMIGETYGSPELIGMYVKSGMLNAQFDFNEYYGIRESVIDTKYGMQELERIVKESMAAYGSHHTMGNISGNHDQVRIASLAGGAIRPDEDGKEAGWTRTVDIGDASVAYRKAMLQEVINFTIPGVPCIYQGDEYGEVGANDPDNRMMMRFDGLNKQEKAMRHDVQRLIQLRRTSMPLLYGDLQTDRLTADEWVYSRTYMGEKITVTINRKDLTYSIDKQ